MRSLAGFCSPARVGGLAVLEDQTCGHLFPHPVPTGLVEAHSKPVTLSWKVLVRGILVIEDKYAPSTCGKVFSAENLSPSGREGFAASLYKLEIRTADCAQDSEAIVRPEIERGIRDSMKD